MSSLSQKMRLIIERESEPEIKRIYDTLYRVGFCCQCGKCCQGITIKSSVSAWVQDWLETYGMQVKKDKTYSYDQKEDITYVVNIGIPMHCQHLGMDENNKYICKIYNRRPKICEFYPKAPSPNRTCTYLFLDTNELKAFIKEYNKYWENKDGKKKELAITG